MHLWSGWQALLAVGPRYKGLGWLPLTRPVPGPSLYWLAGEQFVSAGRDWALSSARVGVERRTCGPGLAG
jgi:hypothetical protein